MLSKTIQFLNQNPDVVSKLQAGQASLVGLSGEEQKAILAVYNRKQGSNQPAYYWA